MTSLKQIEANRRNSLKSTGPRTEAGKQQSASNAVRHGLTAETVIQPLEDADDYQSFEEAVAAGFDPQTAVERELILRLASLLWRLRRATSIETALFRIDDADILQLSPTQPKSNVVRLDSVTTPSPSDSTRTRDRIAALDHPSRIDTQPGEPAAIEHLSLAYRFVRLGGLEGAFERITRYELQLWRQVRQILLALNGFRRRASSRHYPNSTDQWNASHRES
jgi:hypothetical protein